MPDDLHEKMKQKESPTFVEDEFVVGRYKPEETGIKLNVMNETDAGAKTKPKRKPLQILLNIAIAALIAVILYQAGTLAVYYYGLYTNDKTTEEFREIFEEFIPIAEPTEAPVQTIEPASAAPDHTATPVDTTPDNSGFIRQIELNNKLIGSLRQQYKNDDIIGYVYITGTNISYPILQSGDEYYLNHSIDKKYSSAGSIFLDYECDGVESRNTVLYGHNMRNGSMFHDLRYFPSKVYFDSHRTITILTEEATYEYETFSSYSTSVELNYIKVLFESDEEFIAFADKMAAVSAIKTAPVFTKDDRILTLSTCQSAGDDNIRVVLQARLKQITTADGIENIVSGE